MEKQVLTNSKRASFTRCRRRYQYEHIEKLSPRWEGVPLRWGTLMHLIIADLWTGDEWEPTIAAWVDAALVALADAQEATTTEDEIHELGQLAFKLAQRYEQKYLDDRTRYEVLAIEQAFKLPVRVPCKECWGAGCQACGGIGFGRANPIWEYAGKIDRIVRDRVTGLAWVHELKTTTLTDPDKFTVNLNMNAQPRGYVWAAAQLLDEPIHGVLYDVIRRKRPAVPEPLKRGGLSKAKGTDTTYELYAQAIKDNGLDTADYADVLAMLQARGDTFLYRHEVYIPVRDLRDFEAEIWQIGRDISGTDYYYRNLEACSTPGRTCPFRRICLEDDELARRSFVVRDDALPEITDGELKGGE